MRTTKPRGLVVVSNRIPITFSNESGELKEHASSGGLVSALEPLLDSHGGTWVGSPGAEDTSQVRHLLKEATKEKNYTFAPLFLNEEENHNFYRGFSNEVVWPLFHDLQSRCNFDPQYWLFYLQVNRKFVETVEQASDEDDLIWIHDYQLMQVGRGLRERRPKARLAFFLHIPFPPPDIFGKLPWRQQVLEGLLAHDLIGVQTRRDERNLIACLRSFVPSVKIVAKGEWHNVLSEQRQTHIQFFPISINFQEFAEAALAPSVVDRARKIKKQPENLQIALGVDRLDYTKGIPERLKAFNSFLRDYPEFQRRVELVQIVIPSREAIPGYQTLKAEVEQLVARVNGEFSEPGWIPINYIHRSIPRDELVALYRAVDVALITPLKDGMNLVAKEFCASRVESDGVLILSEFAGAAPELRNGAILVNPYDESGIASALKQAFEMPQQERRRRMVRMRAQIQRAGILQWRDHFFQALEKTGAAGSSGEARGVT
jgi:trehalose 6-phosphate synthase/phosphatase